MEKNFGSNLDFYASITKSLERVNQINNKLTGFPNFSDLFKQQAFKQSLGLSSVIGGSAIQNLENYNENLAKKLNPFLPLTSQLSQLVKQQESLSLKLSNISSLSFSENIIKSIEKLKKNNIPDFTKALNSFIVLGQQQNKILEKLPNYLSNSFDFYLRQQDEIDEGVVKNISEDIQTLSIKLDEIAKNGKVANEDIRFINDKLKKDSTSAFIYFMIQIILAILLSIGDSSTENKYNITINNIEKEEIEKSFTETLNLLCLETRKAVRDTYLRSKPNSNSAKIGIVKSEQVVLVQDINHKWVRIVYQNDEYIIQSGWVYKKYFEKITSR